MNPVLTLTEEVGISLVYRATITDTPLGSARLEEEMDSVPSLFSRSEWPYNINSCV